MSDKELLDEIKKIEAFVKHCTPDNARSIMIRAGIVNSDGTLTDRYK